MKKLWLGLIGVVLLVMVVGLAACSSGKTSGTLQLSGNLNNQQEGIWVSGEGKVPAAPDIATLSLGIQSQELTVAEAMSKASVAMDAVMKALKDAGIADKDIQTQYFSIQQVTKWDNDKQEAVVTGYMVTNTVTAKIRDISKAGSVIDAVAGAGGDLTRINNIGFDINDPSAYLEQARTLAVQNAKAKAQKLAEVAGVKLGNPTYINETTYTPGPIYRTDVKAETASGASVPTQISVGEQDVTVNVQIAYTIQ
jgi:uncharacterized protein YggE